MLKSHNTLLSDVNAQPYHKKWVKYYKKGFSISKDFNITFPTLVKFTSILNFKEVDSGLLKRCLINIKQNSNFSLDIELAKLLKIDKTPIPENIHELCYEVSKIQVTKTNEKTLNLIFDCITRYFICFSYQFKTLFLNGKINMTHLPSFTNYYLQHKKDKLFLEDVLILFNSFPEFTKSLYTQIFTETSPGSKQQIELVDSLHALVPISKVFTEDGKDRHLLNFIIEMIFSIFQSIEPNKFPPTILETVISTFSEIAELKASTDVNECSLLCSLASHILSTIPSFSLIEKDAKYKLGSLCMSIYSHPELTLSDESSSVQFDVIINYVLWIVFTFGEKRRISADYEESMSKNNLEPIGASEYFNRARLIPMSAPLVTNEYLAQSAKTLGEMIQKSKYKTVIISLLVEAMNSNQELMKIEQYQQFAAFVLFVIHNSNESSLANGFSNHWNVLLSEALFPEINEQDDRNLRDAVLKIFMRCFISVPSTRSVILNAISDYFTKHRVNELRYFLPLFNNLLALDKDIKFAQELIKSPLMKLLLTESKQYLDIFDLVRHIIFLHGKSCFESRTIVKFCFDCVKVPLYRESMIRCLENALITCTKADDAQHVVSSLVCEISSSIQSFMKTDIGVAKQLVLILGNSMKQFRVEVISTLFVTCTFEILSEAILQINTIEIFELVLSVFVELCSKYREVHKYFLKKECGVYTYLSKYIKKKELENKEIEMLFDFAFLNSSKESDDNKRLIRNYRVIPLILDYAKNKEIETQIYQRFYELCRFSSGNVYELVKADIFKFILERINEVGFNDFTNILFKIYARVASIYLPNSAYFDTLKLICLPHTDYPGKFISLFGSFLNQLKNSPPYYCNNFFHFEESSDGIFGPTNQQFGSRFSFITMIRCENLKTENPIQLLSMVSNKNDHLLFSIVNGQIVMKRKSAANFANPDNSLKSETTTTFSLKLNQNSYQPNEDEVIIEFWMRIIIIVDSTQITLCVGNSKESTQIALVPFQSYNFTVTIGNGFVGDFSDTYFLNEVNLEKINENINNKSIICKYIPRNVNDNCIRNVCNSEVKFSGQSILFVNTISDIIKNESSIMNLLPLFSRFSNCNECRVANTSQRCKNCGSLEINEGFEFFEKLLNYIMMASNENYVFMIDRHFFSILSNYIELMNPCYYTTRFYNLLLSCFKLIKSNELAQEMIESIFQNYDLIMKFTKEQQLEYFKEILPKAYSIQKDVFHNYKQYSFLIFLGIAYFPEESDISINLWKTILTILPHRTDQESYTLILSIPMFHHYNFSSEFILKCFEEMIDNKNAFFIKSLESIEYFIPFTCIFKFPELNLQIQSFKIISKLRDKCETSDLVRAIYQVIEFYSPSENSVELLEFVNSKFLNQEGQIEAPEYFPLIVTISSFIENEKAFNTYEQIMHSIYNFQVEAMKITTDVFNWSFWLLKYTKQFYPEIDEKTLPKFSLPFAKLIQGQILSQKFQYQEIFAQIVTICNHFNIDSRRILKSILNYLFTLGQTALSIAGSDLFKDVFAFIFFNSEDKNNQNEEQVTQISPEPNEQSTLNRFLWFTKQCFSNHYFNIKIGTDEDNKLIWIDHQLAEDIISKISLLSNLTVEIYNEEYSGLLLVTYIIVILMRFESQTAVKIINNKLLNELPQAELEVAHKCASFILRTRECLLLESENKEETTKYLNSINFEELEEFTKFFIDNEDSPALQLFIFENSLFKNTQEINEKSFKVQADYITGSNKFTSSVLSFDSSTINRETRSSNEKNYFSTSTISYVNLMVIYADLLNNQDFYITNAKYTRKQIVESFQKELFVLTNDNTKIDIHYKAVNIISRKGRRVLMSIDYNKLNSMPTKMKKRSRLSSTAMYNSIQAEGTVVRHNKIDLSSSISGNQNQSPPNKQSSSAQQKHSKHNKALQHKQQESSVFRDTVSLLTPHRLYNGEVVIDGETLTFDGSDSTRTKHVEISLNEITFIMKRTYGRFRKAVEVFTDVNRSYYFIFACSYSNSSNNKNKSKSETKIGSQRHNFNMHISMKRSNSDKKSSDQLKYDFFRELEGAYGSIYQKKKKKQTLEEIVSKLSITERWMKRKMSNYEYLYYLNILSGRSFNDISKYPIFPIVLLSKPSLDVKNDSPEDEDSYRNFGHPVGALQHEKLTNLLNSFHSTDDMKSHYLYSSMFSNPEIVSNLLSSFEPFTSIRNEIEKRKSMNIILPKFVLKNESLNDGTVPENDDYELTPEFFTFPAVFNELNSISFESSVRGIDENNDERSKHEIGASICESGENLPKCVDEEQAKQSSFLPIPSLSNVKLHSSATLFSLPRWASSAEDFITTNRRALESDTTTQNLNKWIDLIFGCNRRSSSNVNVYHPLLYQENSNECLTTAENDQQANETGLYPQQLFVRNHPSRQASNLEPLDAVVGSNTAPPSGHGFNLRHESNTRALRIRKNFLITEDMRVTKFTFTAHAREHLHVNFKSQTKIGDRCAVKKGGVHSSAEINSCMICDGNDENDALSSVQQFASNGPQMKRKLHTRDCMSGRPFATNSTHGKRFHITHDLSMLAPPSSFQSDDDLFHTTQYTIPEVPSNFTGDIVEVSRSQHLVIFGSIGDTFISICDLRKCKNSSSNNEDTSSSSNNNSSTQQGTSSRRRSLRDFEERRIGSLLSGVASDDVVFNSLAPGESLALKAISSSSRCSSAIGLGRRVRCNTGRIVVTTAGPWDALTVVRFENAAVESASVSGSVLAAGLSDGTIRVFRLPGASLIHSSSYHNRPVTAITANQDVGILVSADDSLRIVFELLYEAAFVRALKLDKVIEKVAPREFTTAFLAVLPGPPRLLVFKSGTVCCVVNSGEKNSSCVVFFDAKGEARGFLAVDGVVRECDKYYDFDSREILLLGVDPRRIMLVDVADAKVLAASEGSFGQIRFCAVKYFRTVLYSNGRITQTLPFAMMQKPIL